MAQHSNRSGTCARSAPAALALAVALAAGQAHAFELGGLQVDSAPGQAFAGHIPVRVSPHDNLARLTIEAHALWSTDNGSGQRQANGKLLNVTLIGDPNPVLFVTANGPLDGADTRVEMNATLGADRLHLQYALPTGQAMGPIMPSTAPPPVAALPAPAPVAAAPAPKPDMTNTAVEDPALAP